VGAFYQKVMNDNPIRFGGLFRVYKKTFNFLFLILNNDFLLNSLYAFEVGICGMKLEVDNQDAISWRRLVRGNFVLTISELFGFL
jgi:hypothetical protein